ncbi:CobW family GTP-binding protein [Erwinia sp.]|uniref:CobW family GTP-binding protein n=1 Tax=Erwinia citreus TaxID=558 RepID=UPI003C78E908
MQDGQKIPVHVLSGFLGSGKTTLLKSWLGGQALADVALLVNEFGEVGIDHLLLGEVAPDTVLLPSGCVCCQVRGELKQALLDLSERRERGELPPFKKVILETTGLADPSPILSTLLHDRQLQYHFAQGVLVTLVDAEHGWQQAKNQPEWLAQVTAADKLAVSKGDRVSSTQREELEAYLQQVNPLAEIAETSRFLTQADKLFEASISQGTAHQRFRWLGNAVADRIGLLTRDAAMATAPEASGAATVPGTVASLDRPALPLGFNHPQTETCVITLRENINWAAFAVWLSMLLHCHGSSILRMKGILRVQESSTPVVIHGVQHSLHPPVHLTDWPGELESSQLVFILRGLSASRLRSAFLRFQQPFLIGDK